MLIFGGVSSSSWPKKKGPAITGHQVEQLCWSHQLASFPSLEAERPRQMPSNPTQTNTVSFFRLNSWCKMQVLRECNLVVKCANWVKPGDLTRTITQLVLFFVTSRVILGHMSHMNCRKPRHITPKASHTCFPPGAKHIHIISYQCQMHGFMKKTHFWPANVSSPGT